VSSAHRRLWPTAEAVAALSRLWQLELLLPDGQESRRTLVVVRGDHRTSVVATAADVVANAPTADGRSRRPTEAIVHVLRLRLDEALQRGAWSVRTGELWAWSGKELDDASGLAASLDLVHDPDAPPLDRRFVATLTFWGDAGGVQWIVRMRAEAGSADHAAQLCLRELYEPFALDAPTLDRAARLPGGDGTPQRRVTHLDLRDGLLQRTVQITFDHAQSGPPRSASRFI
jgi:hypothetical protein